MLPPRSESSMVVVSTLRTAKSWVSSLCAFPYMAKSDTPFCTATQKDIDGFLVGGASLKPEFVEIINAKKASKN